jgi:alkaline phosphatase D
MANGIKIGEVDAQSAIVWTRLTTNPERNTAGTNFAPYKTVAEQPAYPDLSVMQGSVAGTTGEVRLSYHPKAAHDNGASHTTPWMPVNANADFTHQFHLKNLQPGTSYSVRAEGRVDSTSPVSSTISGNFRTAPSPQTSKSTRFVVTTCGDYPRRDDPENGHKIYPVMQSLDPDFFVHAGDIEYYDKPAPFAINLELARLKWNRIFSMPYIREFHNNVSSYFIKDDHETLKNDAWPGQTYHDLTWEQGLRTFREQVPMGEKTYRTIRWGKDLQIWLVEGRDFRSPNTMKDGPEKTIWGAEQKQWFFDTVQASDATFKVLISPTPVVGPDRKNKNDNHSNEGFTHEGDEIRQFMAAQKNMTVVCGDRHWQYASIDPQTGLREFSCGPASDKHAGGYKESFRNDMHRYLQIIGGFLAVDVQRINGSPEITFSHYNVAGSIQNQETFQSQPHE